MTIARRIARRIAPDGLRRVYADSLADKARRRLDELGRGSTPVLAGPWVSELGFELLYWIPFLRWVTTEEGVDPGRLIAVSRGGADAWYSGIAGRYVDLLDHVSPGQFRIWRKRRMREGGSEKHVRVSQTDEDVVRVIRRDLGFEAAEWFHPSLMYRLFNPHWTWGRSHEVVDAHTRHELLASSDVAAPDVPEPYVTVKAYFSKVFPDTAENRRFLEGLVEKLAERTNVVILSGPSDVGGHEDYRPDTEPERVSVASTGARTNLAEQARLIEGAEALVATYGGFSYLGSYLSKPTLAFYSDARFNRTHLDAMRRAVDRLGQPEDAFVVEHVTEATAAGIRLAARQAS